MEDFFSILRQAREALTAKNYATSRDRYLQAKNIAGDTVNQAIVLAELSWVYYYMQDYKRSIESAEQVLEYNPDYQAREDLDRVQGYAYLGLKNLVLAEKYLQRSLETDAESEKQQYVKYELGKIHFISGNYDLAYPFFIEISERFKSNNTEYFLSVLFYLGFIHYYLKNYSKARENFEQILALKYSVERDTSAYYGLAFLEFNDKNYLNVISLCEKIVTLDLNFFDRETVGFLTAASYYYLGRNDIFAEYYKQMMKTYPHGRYEDELVKMDKNIAATNQNKPGKNPGQAN